MFRTKKLTRLLFGALVVGLAVPLINIFLIYPQFSALLIENIEDSAIRLAQHMESELQESGGWSAILEGQEPSVENLDLINSYVSVFALRKMKIFSATGLTVYSTDEKDIGVLNKNDYFHDHVAKGRIYSKVVKKETESLEGQTYQADVVEVYVPSMPDHKFTGAFELYYDATRQIEALEREIFNASVLPFIVSGFLLLVLFWGMRNLDQSLAAQKRAEEEINTLQGIIPICMYCKEIRDDEGYWNRLEEYISEHSEAQFSHGICDSCMEQKHGIDMSEKEAAADKE